MYTWGSMDNGGDLGFGVFVLVWLVGMMIAVVTSWEVDHSVLWATVRGHSWVDLDCLLLLYNLRLETGL